MPRMKRSYPFIPNINLSDLQNDICAPTTGSLTSPSASSSTRSLTSLCRPSVSCSLDQTTLPSRTEGTHYSLRRSVAVGGAHVGDGQDASRKIIIKDGINGRNLTIVGQAAISLAMRLLLIHSPTTCRQERCPCPCAITESKQDGSFGHCQGS